MLLSFGWLRYATMLAKHFLERVLKQFKHVQGILRDPVASVTPDMNVFQIDRVFMDELDMRMIDEDMRRRVVVNA
jgi:hypothetical protein